MSSARGSRMCRWMSAARWTSGNFLCSFVRGPRNVTTRRCGFPLLVAQPQACSSESGEGCLSMWRESLMGVSSRKSSGARMDAEVSMVEPSPHGRPHLDDIEKGLGFLIRRLNIRILEEYDWTSDQSTFVSTHRVFRRRSLAGRRTVSPHHTTPHQPSRHAGASGQPQPLRAPIDRAAHLVDHPEMAAGCRRVNVPV